jgi:hypothetical protein
VEAVEVEIAMLSYQVFSDAESWRRPGSCWPKAISHRSLGQRPRNEMPAPHVWPKAIFTQISVSPKDRDEAERYVRNQEEHHRQHTFQDEYRAILTHYGINFDEQYVWD